MITLLILLCSRVTLPLAEMIEYPTILDWLVSESRRRSPLEIWFPCYFLWASQIWSILSHFVTFRLFEMARCHLLITCFKLCCYQRHPQISASAKCGGFNQGKVTFFKARYLRCSLGIFKPASAKSGFSFRDSIMSHLQFFDPLPFRVLFILHPFGFSSFFTLHLSGFSSSSILHI